MGFHVDMSELLKLKKTYMDSAQKAENQLDAAKNKMNEIITSNSMYGEVGKAINNEINNSHNAIIVGLKNAYTIMDADFTQTLQAFQDGVGETSETGILDEEVMSQTKTKLTNANTKHSEYESNISQIYTDINDLISLSSPSSKVSSSITNANNVLSNAITKVNSFDTAQYQFSTDSLLTALASQIEIGNGIQGLSYTDPRFVEIVGHSELAEGIKKVDDQITQAKKEQEEAIKKAKQAEEEWKKNHPVQAWIKEAKDNFGQWWDSVKEATKNIDIPVLRETLLVLEGVVGGLGGLIGDVAYLAAELDQLIHEVGLVSLEKVTGLDVAPDWMEQDVNGAVKNIQNVGDFLSKNLTLENGKKILDYSWDLLTDERTRAQALRDTQRAIGQLWDDFSKDGWYNTGGVIFEVGSWFVGAGELKAGLTAAKGTKTFLEGARLFTSTVTKQAVKNADDMTRSLARLATRGPSKTKAVAKSVMNFITDPKSALSHLGDEFGKLRSAAGKWGDNLAEVSPSYHAFRESFRNGLSNLGDNFAYANAHFSDDFSRSGARVYNMAADTGRGARKVTTEFGKEASEHLAKHSDDVAKGLEETGEQFSKNVAEEFVNGKFTDPEVQARYERYLKKKAKQGKPARDPMDWKEVSDRMAKIRNQGRQYELEKLEEFKEIARDVEEQVTIKVVDSEGNIVRTRVDAIGYNKETGELLIREFKSSKMAPLTDNQTAAFEMIRKGADARVVGKGKGIFKGGFEIPAYTEIKVIRPD